MKDVTNDPRFVSTAARISFRPSGRFYGNIFVATHNTTVNVACLPNVKSKIIELMRKTVREDGRKREERAERRRWQRKPATNQLSSEPTRRTDVGEGSYIVFLHPLQPRSTMQSSAGIARYPNARCSISSESFPQFFPSKCTSSILPSSTSPGGECLAA